MPPSESDNLTHVSVVVIRQLTSRCSQYLYDPATACMTDAFRSTTFRTLPPDGSTFGCAQPLLELIGRHVDGLPEFSRDLCVGLRQLSGRLCRTPSPTGAPPFRNPGAHAPELPPTVPRRPQPHRPFSTSVRSSSDRGRAQPSGAVVARARASAESEHRPCDSNSAGSATFRPHAKFALAVLLRSHYDRATLTRLRD
jgi:hypothetical protein